jgi:hypothetical protein
MSELDKDKAFSNEETAMAEALAEYLEQMNNGSTPDAKTFVAQYHHLNQQELLASLSLLALPRKPVKLNVDSAWQNFKAKNFVHAVQPVSLGNYVQKALDSGDAELAKLPQASLEALKQDQTPISDLKDYELKDYAALAKRYGVKDSLFPRMLKWMKGVAKNVSNAAQATMTPKAQYGFARPTDRQRDLSESEIAEALEEDKEQDKEK